MKKALAPILCFVFVVAIFFVIQTFAMYRDSASGEGTIPAATWSVTRSYSDPNDSLELTSGTITDDYTLTVQSNSKVDVIYDIIISNLPEGVVVSLDDGSDLPQEEGKITIPNAGTINYNDSEKVREHTLTFKAISGATAVSEQEIDIDVEFRQAL